MAPYPLISLRFARMVSPSASPPRTMTPQAPSSHARIGLAPSVMGSVLCLLLLASTSFTAQGQGLFERLGFGKKKAADATSESTSPTATLAGLSGLSEAQIASGLKQALSNGVQSAVGRLGTADGFLKDAAVRIAMPDSLRKVEKTLRSLKQDALADEFVTTMNRAAEKAVPEAAAVLGDSLRQMTLADAKGILLGTNNAATDYFRRTSTTNLQTRFLPIVKQATEQTGVTRLYKQMQEQVQGGRFGAFGNVGAGLLGLEGFDLDAYVTAKSLDGLFVKIADEEKRIRESTAARTTDLLKQVFGALQKQN